jgi:GNAT superfamily N-acetyltransferase
VADDEKMESHFSVPLELKIRPCASHDLPQLEWFGLYTDHRQLIEDAFRRQQLDEVMMWVADLGGFPVGQAWLDLSDRAADSVGVIWSVRVLPLLRNPGIGTRLMIAAEQFLCDRGYRWTELTVDQHESRARRLYERLGYRSAGSTEGLLSYITPEKKSVALTLQLWILRKPLRPDTIDWENPQTTWNNHARSALPGANDHS